MQIIGASVSEEKALKPEGSQFLQLACFVAKLGFECSEVLNGQIATDVPMLYRNNRCMQGVMMACSLGFSPLSPKARKQAEPAK